MYFRSYTCITELILVLRNLYLRYRANSCISDTEVPVGITELILILVFRILYLSYRAYTYLTDLILALRNVYLSYGSYTYITKLILVFQILFMCEGTRRYDKSEQIKLIQIHIRYGH